MSRQATVGLFTIIGILALFAVYYVLSDLATRAGGYRIGIHFPAASGLQHNAIVYESGVQVGTVDTVTILDDFTVEVVLAIKAGNDIPRGSEFVIQAPLTGTSTVVIVPPKISREQVTLLPHHVLPIDQQPKGTNPVTVADLLQQGQGEMNK
ncbi:MAG: MCE family protein, partial [Candidatus Eremiobacteraeota bacterium]|nr:MCE family protein [Candidatus Eremiobacteraeota bacterium]